MPYTPPAQADTDTDPDAMKQSDDPYIQELRSLGQGKSEDYQRFSDAQLLAWKPYYQGNGKFKNKYGDLVDKPDERGANTPRNMNGMGVQGDYGAGWNATGVGATGGGGGGRQGGGGGGAGGYQTNGYGGGGQGGGGWGGPAPTFVAPTPESVLQDPGYQFQLQQGQNALQGSAAAKGLLRSGGTLKDLLQYSQGAASTEYGNAYNRALQAWQTKYDPWAQQGNWGLSQWQTQYGGDLQKYLQKENETYGLLNPAMPTAPTYSG